MSVTSRRADGSVQRTAQASAWPFCPHEDAHGLGWRDARGPAPPSDCAWVRPRVAVPAARLAVVAAGLVVIVMGFVAFAGVSSRSPQVSARSRSRSRSRYGEVVL